MSPLTNNTKEISPFPVRVICVGVVVLVHVKLYDTPIHNHLL